MKSYLVSQQGLERRGTAALHLERVGQQSAVLRFAQRVPDIPRIDGPRRRRVGEVMSTFLSRLTALGPPVARTRVPAQRRRAGLSALRSLSLPQPQERSCDDEKVPGSRVGPRPGDLVCGVRSGSDVRGGEVMNETTRPNEFMFYVICADGNTRHDDDFTDRFAAADWAMWGHRCTSEPNLLAAYYRHEIVRVEVSAREFDNLTWPKATPGSPGEAIRESRLNTLHGSVTA